jgi:hypothetical protein
MDTLWSKYGDSAPLWVRHGLDIPKLGSQECAELWVGHELHVQILSFGHAEGAEPLGRM